MNPTSAFIGGVFGYTNAIPWSSAITAAYYSAMALATTSALTNLAVTRAEYLEGGSSYCRRKFGTDYERGGNDERAGTPPSAPARARTRTVSAMKRR